MKLAHFLYCSVFVKEHEDLEKTKESFVSLFPFNLEEEKLKVAAEHAEGTTGKPIIILSLNLDKQRHIRASIDFILDSLSEQEMQKLENQIESRLDEECCFFLRFDKESWMNHKVLLLTDSGDCFHIKINIAAYPNKREKALEILQSVIKKIE